MPFESYSIADDENELKKQFLFSLWKIRAEYCHKIHTLKSACRLNINEIIWMGL